MTAPRQILRGASYLISRRCAQRHLLLTPSRATTETFTYVLAESARRHGVEVHGGCVMPNHYHLVVTDPHARLPAFLQFLDGQVARAMNACLGRQEDFWGPPSYSAVALASSEDIVEKVAYTLANPVAAGLVKSACRWPGFWTAPEQLGGCAIEAQRPGHFFAPDGVMPAAARLELTAPPGFESAEAFRAQLVAALAAKEADAVRLRGARGFMGVRRVLAQRPTARPRSHEPLRRLNPRVAAKDTRRRVALLERLKAFLDAYQEALAAWREGAQVVVFPEGTYLMRVAHGVMCAGAG